MLLNLLLEKTLESPLDCKIKPVNPKGNQPWISNWKDCCWSWGSNTLATWCEEPTHWKKTLMLGKIKGKRRRGQQRMRMVKKHHGLNRHQSEQTPGDSGGFPGGSDSKASVYNVRDLGSIPGLGRFPGEGNGNPLQYSCLENPMDRGAWCRLLSMGSQRVGHDWATSLHSLHWLKNANYTDN